MADIKITDLAAYTDPVSTDVLPIVDVGSDLTKKVSIADLLENAGTGSAAAPSFSFDGDNDTGIYRPGADQLALATNGTGRLIVGPNGEVVINAATRIGTEQFSVNGSINTGGGTSSLPAIAFRADTGTGLFRAATSTLAFSTAATERLRIDSSGLATFASDVKVSGNIEAHSGGDTRTVTLGPANAGIECNVNGVTFLSGRSDAYDLSFRTNSVERARITSGGNFVFGGTLPSAPNISLNANGSAKFETATDFTSDGTGVLELRSSDTSVQAGTENTNLIRFVAGTSNGTTAALIAVGKYEDSSAGRGELTIKVPNTALSSNLKEFKFRGDGTALMPGPVSIGGTAAANTIDEYEEGTWTVTFHDAVSAGNQSATTATGTYTKVGRLVQIQFAVNNISTSGLTAGNQLFFSLPFIGLASPFEEYNGACAIAGSSLASTPIATHLVSSSARAYFLVSNAASGVFSGFSISSITSGANALRVSLAYMA